MEGAKRGRRWRGPLAWIAGLLLFWFVFGYRYSGHHECIDCKTRVWFERRGLGNPRGRHLEFWNSVEETPSPCLEYFPTDHAHRLVFGQSSNSWLFDGWVCALGRGASNGFTILMSQDDRFREFVRARIASGEWTREEIAAMAAVPRDWSCLDSFRRQLPIPETRSDYAPAIDLGARLQREYGGSFGNPEWKWRLWPEN